MTNLTDLIVEETLSLNGAIRAPSSKSLTHRVFIASALSEGRSIIKKPLICDDTLATIEACRMLGAEIEHSKETFVVMGRTKPLTPKANIDCRNSGSTMRFLAPICALANGISFLTGRGSLQRRPMKPLLKALRQLGVQCCSTLRDGYPPIIIFGGGIDGGEANIQGDISSQYISGLLFATPMAKNKTEIILSTHLESKPYVTSTLDVLLKHGIEVEVQPDYRRFQVPPRQRYTPSDHIIEGDYSSAAFLLAAAALTDSHLRVENIKKNSLQSDRMIVRLLEKMGVQIKYGRDFIEVKGVKNNLKPIDVDLHDNPDLVPVCTVVACLAPGKSLIRGVKRLRFKESDRIAALLSELTKLGAKVNAVKGMLEVDGVQSLRGAELDSHEDHRIAMACAILALRADGTTIIHGIECINKSYPDFVRDIISVGGMVVERELDRRSSGSNMFR